MSFRSIALDPFDRHNQRLAANTHPDDYINPKPQGRYNLVVVGAGTAGLVTAAVAAGMGAKVALIEKALMGGDCLNVGCVPSKGVIEAARSVVAAQRSQRFGTRGTSAIQGDFRAAMERTRRLRADISAHDSVARFTGLGVDVFLGAARFRDPESIEVAGETLKFAKAVICTGARAAAPSIPGLDQVDYLTNESLFSLVEAPRRLGVIGAGPIGCEMAQAFSALGCEITLIETSGRVLPREDADASAVLEARFAEDGVLLEKSVRNLEVSSGPDGAVSLHYSRENQAKKVEVDRLLIAVGRKPNVEGLDLDKAGVEFTDQGVRIDDFFRTSNKRVFAAGDICSPYKFTHAADFMARSVIRNALFGGRARHSKLIVPWTTYTAPEIAGVGLNQEGAERAGIDIDTFTQPMAEVDRAILEGETEGFARVYVRRGTDKIVGATIVAPNAGDMIGAVTLAMNHKIGLGAIASAIHPYPTQADAVRKLGDLYNRTRLTPAVAKLFRWWLHWTRR